MFSHNKGLFQRLLKPDVSRNRKGFLLGLFLVTALAVILIGAPVIARTVLTVGAISRGGEILPTGQIITPTASPGSTFQPLATGLRTDGNADAAEAVTTALSPDGKTLLVLTSGYNHNFNNETSGQRLTYPVLDPQTGQPTSTTTDNAEWVFVFDTSAGKLVKKQQINIPNTYNGIAWAEDGQMFYVSGGIDDRVYIYTRGSDGRYVPNAPFVLLGHNSNQTSPFPSYDGGLLKGTPAAIAATGAVAAGVDVSKDGKTLVVANFENDSISVVDTATRQVLKEIKFSGLGSTVATGEFPFDVKLVSNAQGMASKAYVSSQRDDEVMVVDLNFDTVSRIPVGSQPNNMLLSSDQSTLYVANGNSDDVSVIDTLSNRVVAIIPLNRPRDKYKGSNPNSLALSPDEKTLYVTLGGENAVAVVNLRGRRVIGRIPTGWYPNSVTVSANGNTLYVVNAKSNSGSNPSNGGGCPNPTANFGRTTLAGCQRNTTFRNEYNWALEKAGIAVIPVPNRGTLQALSKQVDRNNGFQNRRPNSMMSFLRGKIKHVIYIVKENRTYDQVLGDLSYGNGDPALNVFPYEIAPNHHKLATDYVLFDNFYDSGESSGVGWNWSTYGRTTDYTEKTQSVLYGNAGFNGLTYDYEGTNRNINVALPQTNANPNQINTRVTGLLDPSGNSSILPSTKDVNAPVGDGNLNPNAVGGFLWDAALRKGKSVRNYGFFIDLAYYDTSSSDPNVVDPTKPDPANPLYIPITPTPFADKIPQAPPGKVALFDKTDIYFRGYDQKHPDIYLTNEFLRDVKQNGLANLSLVRLHHDHFGNFSNAVAGVNTVPLQMADNDYATGRLIEEITKMAEWKETAIFILEDDCQNGPDHVDSHRSVAYIISPYTERKVMVSTNYNTVSMLRTMEDLLGIGYLAINDANAEPMADAFTRRPKYATYQAIVPGNLCQAPVDPNLVPACNNSKAPKTTAMQLKHDAQWWAKATEGMYFGTEDKVDAEKFNRIIWAGIKGEDVPYPTERSGADLRANREELLKKWRT
jgi:YVTN family beta-propeller protein